MFDLNGKTALITGSGRGVGAGIARALAAQGAAVAINDYFPERAEDASAELGEVLAASLSAAVRNALLYRSLLETIEEVATARREGQGAGTGSR